MLIKIFLLSIVIFALGVLGYLVLNVKHLPYDSIFNFGDSLSDTGNSAVDHGLFPEGTPYGMTYFKHPSGRMSNGRLIIDFIAEAYGLPFLPAYLNLTKDHDAKKGVNFAYAGATALDVEYFMKSGAKMQGTNNSLSVQLGWFKKLKPSLCKSKEECGSYFKKRLFLVGEIGGNDIFSFIQTQKNVTQLREIIPPMVESITNTITALIEEGAVELGVPGNFPMGCSASLLTYINSTKKEDYDQLGCLIAYNNLIEYFNGELKHAIDTLRKKYPQANIMYFDYYNDAERLFQAPEQYGFDKNEILKTCLGSGGLYNLDGRDALTICPDPSKRINWDGPHLTEAAYKLIAKGLIEGQFVDPPLKSSYYKIS